MKRAATRASGRAVKRLVKGRRKRAPRFVIHKHAARRLHYDLRLEVAGVLRSWALPRGPSLDPRTRRLAVAVEDHPLEYARFEGVIPRGEYGGGTVMVWDTGTYRNITRHEGRATSMRGALAGGHVVFRLSGRKLRGGFSLVRLRKGKKAHWLLVKVADERADARRDPLRAEQRSALTGRTMARIAREGKEP